MDFVAGAALWSFSCKFCGRRSTLVPGCRFRGRHVTLTQRDRSRCSAVHILRTRSEPSAHFRWVESLKSVAYICVGVFAQKCCSEALIRSIGQKCCSELSIRGVGQGCRNSSVGQKCCSEVSVGSVAQQCESEVLTRSVDQKCR